MEKSRRTRLSKVDLMIRGSRCHGLADASRRTGRRVSPLRRSARVPMAAVRHQLQGNVDEAHKYVKVIVDVGRLFSQPLKVAAVVATSIVVLKTSLKEYKRPGSAIKTFDDMAASARKQYEDSEEADEITGDAVSDHSDD